MSNRICSFLTKLTVLLMFVVTTAAAGCGSGGSGPGGTNPMDTGGSGPAAGGTGNGGAGSLGSSNDVGQPCNLRADAGPAQAVYNDQAPECPSGLCLKPVQQEAYNVADTAAYCASQCSTDNDCAGATRDPNDPSDKRCRSGYACGVAFVVGPLCCKKLCLCKDFLGGSLSTPLACDPAQNQGLGCQAASAVAPSTPEQQTDFTVKLPGSACISFPLIDTVSSTPGVQPDCRVYDHSPCTTPGTNGCLTTGYKNTFLPECKDVQGNFLDPASLDPGADNQPLHTQSQIDAVLATVSENSRPCWYLSYDHSASGCATAYNGQRISALWPTGTVLPTGTLLETSCLTCATYDPACATAGQ